MPLAAGSRLDSYEIVAPLGAGGMGEVYRARDATLKRDVAIKVLPEYWSRDPERLRRFEQEAQATAALNHPNIVSIFHVGQYDGSPYIVTELLQGETLRERLRKGPMRLREVLDFGVELARGLAAAHDAGIIHRDLKPENIWVTKDGRVKILDFGLAKLDPAKAASTDAETVSLEPQSHPGQVLGTVGYMSPEQVRGQTADARSDIFAVGVVLVRDADWETRIPEGDVGRNHDRDPERRPADGFATRANRSAGFATNRESLSREEPGQAISARFGPGVRAGGTLGLERFHRLRWSRSPAHQAMDLARSGGHRHRHRRSSCVVVEAAPSSSRGRSRNPTHR